MQCGFAICVLLLTVTVVVLAAVSDTAKQCWQELCNMRNFKSYTDLHSLAKSYVSFSERHNPSRSQSFNNVEKQNALICVNFRDCGLVSPNLKHNCIYRSSQVVSSKEIKNLNLQAVLDLRVLKKSCKRHAEELLQVKESKNSATRLTVKDSSSENSEEDAIDGVPSRKYPGGSSCKKCAICTENFGKKHGVDVPVFHSDLVPWKTKLRVFQKLPTRVQVQAIGEICQLRNPERVVAGAVVDPEVMGPTKLYKLLLDYSKSSIALALKICANKANYPLLVHCIHGKDRTGLIIMLLLLICDVPIKLVVADYIQSELQLKAGRDKGELVELDDFLTSDNVIASKADTMVETIAHLDETYGSARAYCRAIGLTDEDVAGIRTNFMTQADHKDLFDRFESAHRNSGQEKRASFCAAASPVQEESLTNLKKERQQDRPSLSDGVVQQETGVSWQADTENSVARAVETSGLQQGAPEEAPLSHLALQAAGRAVEEKLTDTLEAAELNNRNSSDKNITVGSSTPGSGKQREGKKD